MHNVTGTDGTANGSLDLAFYSGSSGTYNLNGGTLTAGYVRGGAGTSAFNFNGGTLTAGASATDFLQNLTHAYMGNNGAQISTNGFNVTVAQNLEHTNADGAAASDGGLTKTGAGTLTLSGASTYTGATNIRIGTLAITGSVNSPNATLTVDGGGGTATTAATLSLSGTGTLANTASVAVNAGGTLLLGAANRINSAAPLTINAASGPGSGATVAFHTGGFGQSLAALTLASTSVVDLGNAASILRLADSSKQGWSGALARAGYASLTGGEVVPGGLFSSTAVPEPATWLGRAAALLGLGAFARRQRRRADGC